MILIIIRKSTCQIKIVGGYLYQFPTADVTKFHKRGDLKQHVYYIFEVRGLKPRYWPSHGLSGDTRGESFFSFLNLFQLHRLPVFLVCLPHART